MIDQRCLLVQAHWRLPKKVPEGERARHRAHQKNTLLQRDLIQKC